MKWKVVIDEREETTHDVDLLRQWLNDKRICPHTHLFHAIDDRWMCVRDAAELAELCPRNETLCDMYREAYSRALLALDRQVPQLIRDGKEMQALFVLEQSQAEIALIHAQLQLFYGTMFKQVRVLKRFGSHRLEQLESAPIATRALTTEEERPEIVRKHVEDNLAEAGYRRKHWHIDPLVLREIDYMLDTLSRLIEPDFVPFDSPDSVDAECADRNIPREVKRAVWRRDEGRCVECKSNARLEYDHIIPVVKGGSSTERNVQLLCEPCNRSKGATIR